MDDARPFEPQQPEPWLDGTHMRRWLRDEKIIVGTWLLPTAEACQELADVIGGLRLSVGSQESLDTHEARRSACAEAVHTLLTELPAWEDELQGSLERYPTTVDWFIKRKSQELAALRALGEAVENAQAELKFLLRFSLTDFIHPLRKWHDFVEALAELFIGAVLSTNEDLTIGLSNDGAVVRFLAAAIPHITGETPSLQTVARYLQRRRG